MRDEFPKKTKELLAKRVGYLCSNPNCRNLTVGPGEVAKTLVLGEAAHMASAAPNGPRSDALLTSEQRKSEANGIWLCNLCATKIDHDAKSDTYAFPLALLREWKVKAEDHARTKLGKQYLVQQEFAVLEKVLTGHKNFVWDVVVTPDNRHVLSASNDKTVRMTSCGSKLVVQSFEGHQAYVCSIAISSDGQLLATGALDGAVKVWNLQTFEKVADLRHGALDAKVAWQSGSQSLISGGSDGRLRIWNLEGKCLREVALHQKPILKIAPLPNCADVVSVSADRTVRLCCSDTCECLRILEGHTGEVNSVAVIGNTRSVISASEDRTLRVWNLNDGTNPMTLHGHEETIWRVAVNPAGKIAASGSADNMVFLWDLSTGECFNRLIHPDCVAAVAFSPDGTRLTVGCDDHRVYLYRLPADGFSRS